MSAEKNLHHLEGFHSLPASKPKLYLNERELIQQLRNGEEPAFRWLVETYRNKVYNTVLNILQDKPEAEDTAQDVFIQLYESIAQFKEESSLSTWIYRITIRKALDKIRRRKARQRLQQIVLWRQPRQQQEDKSFDHPGIVLDKKETAAALFKAITTLPVKQQLAFTLIKVQGLSYAETSAIMDKGIKALESLINRATNNLQRRLEQYYNDK